jgi:hypothetical protein
VPFTLRPARVHDADGPPAKRRTKAGDTGRARPIFTESSCSASISSYTRDRLSLSTSAASHGQQQLLHPIVSSLVLTLQLATLSTRSTNKAPTC